MSTTTNPAQFALLSRILHWLMAALLVAMLFIGVSMVSSLGDYHRLLAIHRPLGILILILAAIRLITRLLTRAPALPANIAPSERLAIKVSELMLYTLFIALPLVTGLAPAADIRVEVRRGATTVTIVWPVQAAGDCAAWLREWLG